ICKERDTVDSKDASDEVSFCLGIILLSDSSGLESSLSVTPSYDKKLSIEVCFLMIVLVRFVRFRDQ
ncbi:11429_t:CDS:1, partial [Gigaspora rosea]